MGDYSLDAIEARFADIIWKHEPIGMNELIQCCEKEFQWKQTTTCNVLKQLMEKNIFQNEDGIVTSLISREEFYDRQRKEHINSSFQGSLPKFLAAFTTRKKPSKTLKFLGVIILAVSLLANPLTAKDHEILNKTGSNSTKNQEQMNLSKGNEVIPTGTFAPTKVIHLSPLSSSTSDYYLDQCKEMYFVISEDEFLINGHGMLLNTKVQNPIYEAMPLGNKVYYMGDDNDTFSIDLSMFQSVTCYKVLQSDLTDTNYRIYLLDDIIWVGKWNWYGEKKDAWWCDVIFEVEMVGESIENKASQNTIKDDSSDILEQSITDAILSQESKQFDDSILVESHIVLKTVEKDNQVSVYAMVLSGEYRYDDTHIITESGSHMPVAMTFQKKEDGTLSLAEYWIPEDGSYYTSSIREKFPNDIYEDALVTQKYIKQQMISSYGKLITSYNIDYKAHIESLLNTICAPPRAISSTYWYIETHEIEYRELLFYGNYAIEYYEQMTEEEKNGLEGQIIKSAISEIEQILADAC